MFYLYALKTDEDGNNYFGFASNLKKRLVEYEKGYVISKKKSQPLKLIYLESFGTDEIAKLNEDLLK